MYVNIGNNTMIREKDILAIFDFESSTIAKRTRDFLKKAEEQQRIVNIAADLPKSFVICTDEEKKTIVYLSQLSSMTLLKRFDYPDVTQNNS